jgi:hypothetical protein
MTNAEQLLSSKPAIAAGLAGAGAAATPSTYYSDYLLTHGFLSVSLANWFQIIGGVWITVLLIKELYKLVMWTIKRLDL